MLRTARLKSKDDVANLQVHRDKEVQRREAEVEMRLETFSYVSSTLRRIARGKHLYTPESLKPLDGPVGELSFCITL
uniref:Uncharacterized protein n=1 Tax=Lepeophtheirus salmonis TaxID=72036 RepID=A0A0K2TZU9_LEPSM